MSICESAEGLSVAATRQCAGSTAGGAAGAPPRPAPPCPAPPRPAAPRPPSPAGGAAGATGPPGGPCGAGGVNGPAGTSWAEVIVVFGSVRVRSVSHGAACASMAMNDNAVRLIMGVVYTPAVAPTIGRSRVDARNDPW